MEIGTKATALGRRRIIVVVKFDLCGGYTKVASINIRSAKLIIPEPLLLDTCGDGGDRAASDTMATTGDTTVTYPVSFQVCESPAPDP